MIIRLPVKEVVCFVYTSPDDPEGGEKGGEGRRKKKKRKRAREAVLSREIPARSRGVTRANLSNYLIVEHLVVSPGTAMSN